MHHAKGVSCNHSRLGDLQRRNSDELGGRSGNPFEAVNVLTID